MADNEHLKYTATLPLYYNLGKCRLTGEFFCAFATLILSNSHFWVSMLQYSWRPFHWCINYQCRTDIDEAKVISARRHKSKFNFELFWKKNLIFGFPWCSTREDLSIDASITNIGLILTKLWWFFSRGTDGQTRIWNPHMETCRHTKNFNSKLKISG